MTSWGMVLLVAAAAVAGGLTTAWFARPMRLETSTGTQELATALLTLRLGAAMDQRQREARRPVYLDFLLRIDAVLRATGEPAMEERRAVASALDVLELWGPADVVEAARHLASLAQRDGGSPSGDVEQARTAFLTAARAALGSAAYPLPVG
ncbi:hypothetical protein [Streptomyces sp. bgisy060]|uniref:hypothetical protein n=1 Tax=Streptomyces sp. bgisy060 TaxID=3413775 RepID=UPI003EBAB75A